MKDILIYIFIIGTVIGIIIYNIPGYDATGFAILIMSWIAFCIDAVWHAIKYGSDIVSFGRGPLD